MAASNTPAPSAVIPTDSSRPFTPRTLIADLLRTRYCVPGSVLLVEKTEPRIPVSRRYRTVRLLLGDGELCIQALLRPEAHRFVDSGQLYAGCYVRLTRFELRSLLVRSHAAGGGDGSAEPEEMVYLIARDLAVVGWNSTYTQMVRTTMQENANETGGVEFQPSSQALKPLAAEEPTVQAGAAVLIEGTVESRYTAEAPQQQAADTHSTHSAIDSLYSTSNDLNKPVKLTPLKSIPNLPYKQNWVVNILAILCSLSDVEAATLPPFKQRTARLADPSTKKQVLLTVFLDPDEFTPAVGSVVLLLGVKNHRFDGGSLKKYSNEIPKEGTKWWIENPRDVEWCDVEGLKRWWTQSPSP